MGRAGRALAVEHFSALAQVRKTESLYAALLKQGGYAAQSAPVPALAEPAAEGRR
jgi:hypothetical protein